MSTKFVLKQIDIVQLDNEYILPSIQDDTMSLSVSQQDSQEDTVMKVTNSLEMIGWSKSRTKPFETIVVAEELQVRLFITPNINLSSLKKCCCWYCRHAFPSEWHPIGIPIKHRKEPTAGTATAGCDSFECEGVFCSFNCVVAYLQEHAEYRYKDSSVLLLMLYRKVMQHCRPLNTIVPSPSWKLLREYGGHLSIDEYRKCIQHVEYKSMLQQLQRHEFKVQQCAEVFIES